MKRWPSTLFRSAAWTLVAAALAGSTATAQRVEVLSANTLRFELGQRLRALEAALERARDDEDAIARAMPIVNEAVQSFFGLSLDRAAERLDAARFALQTSDEVKRAHARLAFLPAKRLIDPAETESLTISHGWVYGHGSEDEQDSPGDGFRYRIVHRLVDRNGTPVGDPVAAVFPDLRPAALELKLPPFIIDEDLVLESTITPFSAGGAFDLAAPQITRRCGVSIVGRTPRWLERMEAIRERAKSQDNPTIAATVTQYANMLRVLSRGRALETDVPMAALLREVDAMSAHLEDGTGPYFGGDRVGERWIRLAVPSNRRASGVSVVPLRLWTPEGVAEGERVPLVIALHGAGGSENMFFDGYGDGLARQLAEDRGWAFVSPLTQSASADLVSMIDELATRYPVDTSRVFLLGHSMGAAKAIDLIQVGEGRFAAASALGGGGRVRRAAELDGLPVLVGCGSRDFARNGARSLHEELERAGAASRLEIYDDIEHLTVVQIALPDVYSFFDRVIER